MPNYSNTSNPWGTFSNSTGTSTGSSGTVVTNPWAGSVGTGGAGGTSGGGGGGTGGGSNVNVNNNLLNADPPVFTGNCPPGYQWNSNTGSCETIGIVSNPAWNNNNAVTTRNIQGGSGAVPGNPYFPGGDDNMTQRGGSLLPYLNLGISGMRAATARGGQVRSPFKSGGGSGGAATDLEKFDNQLLAMGSEYLGKNVAGFDQGGRVKMYDNGGGFYNKAQGMKREMMKQAMQSGIVAAQLDNVRNTNNNQATARDLVGKMRSFARGGKF